MDKDLATFRLGGTPQEAARWIGVSSAIYQEWPEQLHPVMTDRVYAAILRREMAKAMGLTHRQFFSDMRGESVIEAMLTRVSMAAVMAALMERVPPEFAQQDAAPPRAKEGRRRGRPARDDRVTVITPQQRPVGIALAE